MLAERLALSALPAAAVLLATAALLPAAAQDSERMSWGIAGTEGNDISYSPSISADGRFVAFETGATNLLVTDTNANKDVLVRDRLLGVTAVISVNSAGFQGDAGHHNPHISADGRYVVFDSWSTNLHSVVDTATVRDVFLRDRDPDDDGLFDEANATTEQISLDEFGLQPDAGSWNPKISGDGTVVAFGSGATDLAAGVGGSFASIWARDLTTDLNELVTKDLGGLPANGTLMDISRDGLHVIYWSLDSDLVPGDTNGKADVFVYDRSLGTTTRVSVTDAGAQSTEDSLGGALSADGRYAAFHSRAVLSPADGNIFVYDVYRHDRDPDANGIFDEGNGTTTLVSVNSFGVQTAGAIETTYSPGLSDDGRWVAFTGGDSSGSCCDLVVEDVDGGYDVMLRDMKLGVTTRISVDDEGAAVAPIRSWAPDLSADGRVIAFSTGDALDVDDTNTHEDVYVRDQTVWRDEGWNMAGSTPIPPTKSVPTLSGTGELEADSVGALTLIKTKHGATTLIAVGFSRLDAPPLGGTLVPSPDIVLSAVTSSPAAPFGGWSLPFTWPSGVPSGFEVFLQVWVDDSAGPEGMVSSNGLSITAP